MRNRSVLTLMLLGAFGLVLAPTLEAQAVRTGYDASTLDRNDDLGVGPVALGFTIDFFGFNYSNVYLNTNGNLTFGSVLNTYTPFGITGGSLPMFAPFCFKSSIYFLKSAKPSRSMNKAEL